MRMPIAVMVLVATSATAQTNQQAPKPSPTPANFARQIPVRVTGQNGVVQFVLPLSVYQQSQHNSLADVRLFNSAGSAIPFTFVEAHSGSSTEWRDSDVKMFPVQTEPVAAPNGLELDVRAAQDGTVLSVYAKQNNRNAGGSLQALVLDLGAAHDNETLDSLQFELPQGVASYRAGLAIEQSEDLKTWDRVAQSHVDWLVDASQSNKLLNDRIELAARRGRYLRVRWTEGMPVAFARVAARWRSTRNAADDTLQIELQGKPGRFTGDFIYSASPAFVAHEIGLDLPNPNTVVPAVIGYYRQIPPPKQEWHFIPLAQNTFYRLTQNGTERVSSRVHIYPQALSEWVVRTQATDVATTLVLRLKPKTVIFTAQGGGDRNNEYVLAFGASAEQLKLWSTSETSLSQVAPGFGASELALVERATLGDAQATRPPTESSDAANAREPHLFDNRTLILWCVLILGTLVLGGMSWRLIKNMQSSNKDTETPPR